MNYMDNEIKLGELIIDTLTLQVKRGNNVLDLEPKWVKVFITLATVPNKVLTRQQIIEQVWEDYIVGEDSLNRAISKLRKAIEPIPDLEIKTARGVGYQLVHEGPLNAAIKRSNRSRKSFWLSLGTVAILATAVALLIIPPGSTKQAAISTGYQTHITSDLGIEYSPDISPNNKFVAYTWNGGQGSQWNIYVKQIGLEGSKRLTYGEGSDQSASWSNTGDKLAFFQNNGEGWSLYTKTFLGTEERELFRVSGIWKTTNAITWARDDSSLLFSARKRGDKKYSLNSINLKNLSITEIKSEEGWDYTMPRFSPDHSLIATVAHQGVRHYLKDAMDSIIGKIQVLDAATGRVVYERSSQKEISSIDWKSNSSLIFTLAGTVGCRLYEVEVNNESTGLLDFDQLLPVFSIPDVVRSITYQRASNDLYLERWRADVNIWKAKYNQDRIIENSRAIGSTLFDFNPKLTPDESKLAYISDKSNNLQIWLYDLITGTSRQLTNHKGFANINSIDWSGDGSKMVVSMKKKNQESYASIIDTLGRETLRIERIKGVNRPVWAEDDRSIYAILYDTANNPAIWQYEIESNQWNKFSDRPSVYVRAIDGYLYYMKHETGGLWRTPLSSPDKEELVTSRLPKARADYWTIHGDTLKMINLDFEKSFLELFHVPSQKLLSSSEIPNYIPYGQAGASFTQSNEVYFSSIDNYDADIVKVKLPYDID
ncbi:MAG: hypothetical protein HEP71_20230 [Roseivirga sp.]|nr:hypothetical protein [Roseivirga sp.]